MNFKTIVVLFMIIIMTTLSCGPGKKTDISPLPATLDSSGETGYSGEIIGIDGSVSCTRNSESLDMEIGDEVFMDDTIVVEPESSCEIQFGETAIVKIEEDTIVTIASLIMSQQKTDISLGLSLGTVLCKVTSLAENENFDIETTSAVCGVRGTEFMVIETSEGSSLSVKAGKVALIPGGKKIKELKLMIQQSDSKDSEELITLMKTIEDSAAIVAENQELTIKKEDVASIKENLEEAQTLIKEVKGPDKIPESQQEKINIIMKKTNDLVQEKKFTHTALSEENREKLKKLDSITLQGDKNQKKEERGNKETDEPKDRDILVSFKISPRDAELYINKKHVGKGNYSGKFMENSTLEIRVEKEGFITEEQIIKVQKDTGTITISLKKEKKKNGPTETPQPHNNENRGTEAQKETTLEEAVHEEPVDSDIYGSFNITTDPPGADIYISNEKKGMSPCIITNLEPGNYQIKAELKGYKISRVTRAIHPGKEIMVEFILINEEIITGKFEFLDDNNDGGTSKFTMKEVTDRGFHMKGSVTDTISYGFLSTILRLDQGSKSALFKAKGISIRAKGDGNSFFCNVELFTVKDYNFHYIEFVLPKEETEMTLYFDDLEQANWEGSPKIAFRRYDITAISFKNARTPHENLDLEILEINAIYE